MSRGWAAILKGLRAYGELAGNSGRSRSPART
jgi:hypothetical protein